MRQWVNEGRTVLATLWDEDETDEKVSVLYIATRPEQRAIWGPPVRLIEEKE